MAWGPQACTKARDDRFQFLDTPDTTGCCGRAENRVLDTQGWLWEKGRKRELWLGPMGMRVLGLLGAGGFVRLAAMAGEGRNASWSEIRHISLEEYLLY